MTKRPSIIDFGFNPHRSAHHFAVVVSGLGEVTLVERFTWLTGPELPVARPPLPKAVLDAYHWSRIEAPVAETFNIRLIRDAYRPAVWKHPETVLSPYFGKELVLLAWAVEDADPSLIPNMLANWRGLAPEERWWLYTTINATSGHPDHGKNRGWRQAIKIAFADNPVQELRTAVAPASSLLAPRPRRKPQPQPEALVGSQDKLPLD